MSDRFFPEPVHPSDRARVESSPALASSLLLELEFARAEQAGDPFGFRFAQQDYLVRSLGGGFASAHLVWNESLLADLEAVRRPGRDPEIVQRLGEALRHFLSTAGWAEHEAEILDAVQQKRRVIITIRSAAAELYALPWEFLALKRTGQLLGELPWVLLRYEWPETHTAPLREAPIAGAETRILLAWSAAGGAVPAAEHIAAVEQAEESRSRTFERERDVLAHASCGRLVARLQAAIKEDRPIAVLHVLCHGAAAAGGTSFGIVFDAEEPGAGAVVVDAARLRQLLSPFAEMVRLVLLCVCDSGNSGALGSTLGSIAQTLHRIGIAAVVASRYPLSVPGSIKLAETLYGELLGRPASLESALLPARARLAEQVDTLDWAGLQLYARAADGDDTRPLVVRPYRGLLVFQPEHHRFFFGRDKEIEQIQTLLLSQRKAGLPRLCVVAGASGTGKSSVVLAGAVPRLLAADPALRCVIMRPGSDPDAAMERALGSMQAETMPGASLLLVVDQLEEIFTHVETPERRQNFVQRLWKLASDFGSGVSVLVTLRVDFIGTCGELKLDESGLRLDTIAYDEAHRVFLSQLGSDSLRAAIEEPARAVGLTLEEGLAMRMLADVGAEPGALPLLEDTLDLLWQRRRGRLLTQAAYEELGTVAGALYRRADALIDGLSQEGQQTARRMLVRLVSVADNLALSTRRRVPLRTLRPDETEEATRFDRLLSQLIAARLVVSDGEGESQTIEVAHEALIRKWRRLSEWVSADRQMLADLARIEGWVRQWEDKEMKTLLVGSQIGYVKELAERYKKDFPKKAAQLLVESEARVQRQQRRQRWTQRLIVVVVVVFAILGLYARNRAARANQEAAVARDALRLAEVQALPQNPALRVRLLREFESDDPARMSGWLQAVTDILRDTAQLELEIRTGQPWKRGDITLSADCQTVLAAPEKGAVRIWRDGKPAVTKALPDGLQLVSGAPLDPVGKRFVAAQPDGTTAILTTEEDSEPRRLVGHTGPIACAGFSANGRLLITGSHDRTARVWDAVTGTAISVLRGHSGALLHAALSSDGRYAVTLAADSTLRVWGVEEGRELIPSVQLRGELPIAAQFSADDEHVFLLDRRGLVRMGSRDGTRPFLPLSPASRERGGLPSRGDDTFSIATEAPGGIRLWSQTGARQFLLAGPQAPEHYGAMVCTDHDRIATVSSQGIVRLWRLGQPALKLGLRVLPIHHATSTSFSADGRRFLVASQDRVVQVWSADAHEAPVALIEHADRLSVVNFSRDGKKIVAGSQDGTVRVYSAETGNELAIGRSAAKGNRRVTAAAFSPDGRKIVTAWAEKTAAVWRAEDGELLFELSGHQAEIISAGFSPDGQRIVTAAKDWTARIWNADGKGDPAVLTLHPFPYWSVSPDGSLIATSSFMDPVQIRRLDGSAPPLTLGLPAHAYALAWSPDGRRIALGYQNQNALALWNTDGQGEPTLLKPYSSLVRTINWSANGARILVAGRGWGEPSALVWNGDGRGSPIALPGQDTEIISAALSADGKTAVTIGKHGSAWQWQLDYIESLQTSVLRKQLWSTVRYCPTDPELEEALNRSLTNPGWDDQICNQMLECLYGSALETGSSLTRYDDCLGQFRDRQSSWRRGLPNLL